MSATTVHLLAEFESLPEKEKQVFAKEILRRLPLDSDLLDDDLVAASGNKLALTLADEKQSV